MLPRPAPRFDPAEPEDLPAAWEVYLACSEPSERDGHRRPDPAAPELPPPLYAHLLASGEGSFWVARAGERIVGFAAALPRGRVWLLSELWVAPAYRNQGIGTRLYRMARRSVRGTRGRLRVALGGDDGGGLVLGLRDGLVARGPVFRVEGSAEAAARLWESERPAGPRARVAPYDSRSPLGRGSPLLRLDQGFWGTGRVQDHPFLLADPARTGYLVWMAGRPAGYFYVHRDGEIGPLSAQGPAALRTCLRHAVREAARAGGRPRLRVPALAVDALDPLVRAGFRLVGGGLLLASSEPTGLHLYLPGDDALF